MLLEMGNLKDSNKFLSTLLDNITSAIFIVDKSIRIHSINDPFHVLFDQEQANYLGTLCGNALGCEHATEQNCSCGDTTFCNICDLRASLLQTLTEQVPVYRKPLVKHFYRNNEKIIKYLAYTTKYIRCHDEEMILIIVDDLTTIEEQKLQLEQKNKELEALNLQKNEFLGMAAHDLRNPISIVKMYSAFILKQMRENLTEEQIEFLQVILRSAHFMLNLLDDMLDITKIEAGKLELKKTVGNFERLIKKNCDRNRKLASQKQIALDLQIVGALPKFSYDSDKIEQVLNNLISNAIKYSNPNTTITVQVLREDSYITTNVIDQGQGIRKEEIPLLFKAFQKSSTRATSGEKSTGLGLAIVKKIIEGHRGIIEVESELNHGSTFRFKLPISND